MLFRLNCPLVGCLFLLTATITIVSCDEEEGELKIDVTHKPTKCDRVTSKGDLLKMHYRGTLLDGTEFDSSYSRNEPFQFQLGINQVIQGWDQGLLDMCVGEKRKLTIPSHLGYGDNGAGNKIPPKATLLFEVECVSIEDGPPPVNVFKEIDSNSDNQLSREEISEYLTKQLPNVPDSTLKDLPDHDNLIEEIFQNEDKDRNGYISHKEFTGPKHDEL
ncbi:FK506-binding protein 2-like [Panonychus citri]|uniref:FK506-binding protein 2-like n=1 Tax=Panonychus citri TaxID=50023 RepID=UPI002306F5B8|nr:FK506-binding protein 2-like [Panonychus citri]XP_053212517.1 FK506-binding protein 2-like [Panonychus citri]XP_053214076.1 FK506-binding protein 2-like [Panonychus citri]